MKNKKIVPLICLTLGIVLVIFCLIGKGLEIFETYKTLFGIMLGVGSGLFGGGLGQLINVYLLDKDPVLKRKKKLKQMTREIFTLAIELNRKLLIRWNIFFQLQYSLVPF